MHRMFSGLPGFYPPDASSTKPPPSTRQVVTAKSVSRHCQMPGVGGEEVKVSPERKAEASSFRKPGNLSHARVLDSKDQ